MTTRKRKQRPEEASSQPAAEDSLIGEEGDGDEKISTKRGGASPTGGMESLSGDDPGSSRLFQAHRTIGLLTAASSNEFSMSSRLFRSLRGKFHLHPGARSSEEALVTIPLGDRFQIMRLSNLAPVVVSRSLPPSAVHHRAATQSAGVGREGNGGEGEEEMHRAMSDSSLSITVATHGPRVLGRAVSVTLFSRGRPLVCLDAFPFLRKSEANRRSKKEDQWGIVDMIHLGKQRVAMTGEGEGKTENSLLLALVCARKDSGQAEGRRHTSSGQKVVEEECVKIIGDDSEDESHISSVESSASDDESSREDSDSISTVALEDKDRAPEKDCYGRVLLVRATRTSLDILKTIDLNGMGSYFIPHVGLHPSTYVNKIVLGGRSACVAEDMDAERKETFLLLINVRSGKMIHSFKCLCQRKDKREVEECTLAITALAQSPAVDTVAVGSSNGSVHLVNVLHDIKLFTLRHKSKYLPKKSSNSDVSATTSISFRTDGNATRQGVAPIAVGTDDGSVSVWDLTPVQDEVGGKVRRTLLTQMEGVHHGGVSGLEYLPGEPLLLSMGLASNSVIMHVFDAPDHSGRVLRQRKGHISPPSLLRYLHQGVGGGGILADTDGSDPSSCQLLSCGGPGDLSLRVFSTVNSRTDKEYSQGPGMDRKAKKIGKSSPEGRAELLLPEIVALATSEARSRDWGDLVTIHCNHAMAYVWSTNRGSQSGPVLRQPQWNISVMKDRPPRSAHATSLAISACGNFALVGTRGGVVYKYNLQSGLPRGSFPNDATSPTVEEERRRRMGLKFAGDVGRTMRMLEKNSTRGGMAISDIDHEDHCRKNHLEAVSKRKAAIERASHSDAVMGIAIDSLNKTVVTAGADSKLVLWNFLTHMPHKKSPIFLPSPAERLCHMRDSDLAAIAMTNFGVAVFDCSSLTIVRHFRGRPCGTNGSSRMPGHSGSISDMSFGPDGRRLLTSSLDGTVIVWDVPTGVCVDWMSFSTPPTSLALSPTGEFLATSHVGRLGINLWCDKSFFRTVLLDGAPDKVKMNEPCPVAECGQEQVEDAVLRALPSTPAKRKERINEDQSDECKASDVPPLVAKRNGLITLSGLPPAHWKNLFHLELVKERNQPAGAPQKPPQAPFFLQWRSSLESQAADATSDQTNSRDSINKGLEIKHATGGWDAVWSDEDEDAVNLGNGNTEASEKGTNVELLTEQIASTKRRKVVHQRSKLAELLQRCHDARDRSIVGVEYFDVTHYLSGIGPSSIDVEISSLCYGVHDLDEGLPLLHLASKWLLEACKSRESFEAVNAYLHRFLHVHSSVITRIDHAIQEKANDSPEGQCHEEYVEDQKMKLKEFIETITQLREKQKDAASRLQGKMQHTLCLLRHLSRMI